MVHLSDDQTPPADLEAEEVRREQSETGDWAIERRGTGVGFNEMILGAVLLMALSIVGLAVGLYVLSPQGTDIPELQPGVRVASEADFPIGASRIVSWGDDVILVVRSAELGLFALEGTSAGDGCILRWDNESLRIVSPCTYMVYDVHGHVVRGLTTAPLRRYSVFVRNGTIFVTGG